MFFVSLFRRFMETYSDSDTSSESECESDKDPTPESNLEDVEPHEELEPEPSAPNHDEYKTFWTPVDQLKAQIDATYLQQLHRDIKAQAILPEPTYQKLSCSWPARDFTVRTLPDYVQSPIHYFELLWTTEVWDTLVENTNAYALWKNTRHKANKDKKSRWWKATNIYEIRVFIALLVYIGLGCNSNVESYWSKIGPIHKPMQYMTYYRFRQIKRYFHISPPPVTTSYNIPSNQWYLKLAPLFSILRTQFQAYIIPAQNVSFDEMMVPFTGRSKHTIKIKNKPISEGFKLWALC